MKGTINIEKVTKFIFGVNEMKKIDNGRVIDIT